MASKSTNATKKVHLERPEAGQRGKTMCGVKAPTERLRENKKGVTCGTCVKTITTAGSWFAKKKFARKKAEKL